MVRFDQLAEGACRFGANRVPSGGGECVGAGFEVESESATFVADRTARCQTFDFESRLRSCNRLVVIAAASSNPLFAAVLLDVNHDRVKKPDLDVIEILARAQGPVVVTAQLA